MTSKLLLLQYFLVMKINDIQCQSLTLSTNDVYISSFDSSIMEKTSVFSQLQTIIKSETTEMHSDVNSTTTTTELYDSTPLYTLDDSQAKAPTNSPLPSTTNFVAISSFTEILATSLVEEIWSSESVSYLNTLFTSSTDILKGSSISENIRATSSVITDIVSPSSVITDTLPTLPADDALSTMSVVGTLSASTVDNKPIISSYAAILPTSSVLPPEEVFRTTSVNISPVMSNIDTLTLSPIILSTFLYSQSVSYLNTLFTSSTDILKVSSISENIRAASSVITSPSSVIADTLPTLSADGALSSMSVVGTLSSTYYDNKPIISSYASAMPTSSELPSEEELPTTSPVNVSPVMSNVDKLTLSSIILSMFLSSSAQNVLSASVSDISPTSEIENKFSSSFARDTSTFSRMLSVADEPSTSSIAEILTTSFFVDVFPSTHVADILSSSDIMYVSSFTYIRSVASVSSTLVTGSQEILSQSLPSNLVTRTTSSYTSSSISIPPATTQTDILATTQTWSTFMSSSIIAGSNSSFLPWGSSASILLPSLPITLSIVLIVMYFIS